MKYKVKVEMLSNALRAIANHDPETCYGITPRDCVETMREMARTAIAKLTEAGE